MLKRGISTIYFWWTYFPKEQNLIFLFKTRDNKLFFAVFRFLTRRYYLIYSIRTSPRIYTVFTGTIAKQEYKRRAKRPGDRQNITCEFVKITLAPNARSYYILARKTLLQKNASCNIIKISISLLSLL